MESDKITQKRDLIKEEDLQDSEGRYEKAITAYDKVLQINPDDPDALFNKGITLTKMGKNSEGMRCIEAAINLDVGR